jgi:hypothetical protein
MHDQGSNMICPVCDKPIAKDTHISHMECMLVLVDTLNKDELEKVKVMIEEEEYKRRGIRDS